MKYIITASFIALSLALTSTAQADWNPFSKNKKALDQFTSGSFELSAQASAVAVKTGASSDAVYDNGMAIFTMAKGGLMYEASVAGQKFSFKSRNNDN